MGGRGGNGRPGNGGCSTTSRRGPDARAPHSLIRLRAKHTAAAVSQHVVTSSPVHCHTRIRRRNNNNNIVDSILYYYYFVINKQQRRPTSPETRAYFLVSHLNRI